MYHVTMSLHDQTSLYNASKVLAGLYRLAAEGAVVVRVTSKSFAEPQAAVLQLTVESDDGATEFPRRVAIDLLDRSDIVDGAALAACDVYFKRSIFAPDLQALRAQPGIQNSLGKVRPWGLNFPCHSAGSKVQRWSLVTRCFAKLVARAVLRGPQAAIRVAQEVRQFACLPNATQFEVAEQQPLEPLVVFQSRLWEPHEAAPDNADEVNRLRVDVVRALRRGLGRAFLGGLVATPLSRRLYPDEVVAPEQSRMGNYAALSRRALIGVYTRGLHHSTAFKLPEYLAGSKVIVAEGLRNELPEALERDRHWISFRDPEECVTRCQELLKDLPRCPALRRAAGEYYRRHVEPTAHVRWTLEEACRPCCGPAHSTHHAELELASTL
jgi:hypothetical protein